MSQRHDTDPRTPDDVVTVVEPLPAGTKAAQPRMRRIVVGTAIACLATLWLAATGWLLATW